MADWTEQVEAGSFLASLAPPDRIELQHRGRRRRWRKGAALWVQGEPSLWIAVLLSGAVKVSWLADDGKEALLAIQGPGMLVGELEVADGRERLATVSALEPAEALILSCAGFSDFLQRHDGAVGPFTQALCTRLRYSERSRIEFATLNVTGRVVRRLLELAERCGQSAGPHIMLPQSLTQVEVAGWTAASREAVSKALALLRERGWIETGRRRILIRDLDALRKIAE